MDQLESSPGRPFSREEFVGFLLAAKRSTYAGQVVYELRYAGGYLSSP